MSLALSTGADLCLRVGCFGLKSNAYIHANVNFGLAYCDIDSTDCEDTGYDLLGGNFYHDFMSAYAVGGDLELDMNIPGLSFGEPKPSIEIF